MGRYRKIDVRIHNDEKFRRFPDDTKLCVFVLMTHPFMTCLGAMRASVPGLAVELRWPPRRLERALGPAIECGMVEMNTEAFYIGLPNFLRYNEPEGPNSVVKAWPAALDLIPECGEKQQLIERCQRYIQARSPQFRQAIGHGFWNAIDDGIPDPSAIQEQEQEPQQEQEPHQERRTVGAAAAKAASPPSPRTRIKFDLVNGITGVTDEDLKRWSKLVPAVDINREKDKAAEWLRNNPNKRRSNVAQFLTNWIVRAQDDAARRPHAADRNGQAGTSQPRSINDAWVGRPNGRVQL